MQSKRPNIHEEDDTTSVGKNNNNLNEYCHVFSDQRSNEANVNWILNLRDTGSATKLKKDFRT